MNKKLFIGLVIVFIFSSGLYYFLFEFFDFGGLDEAYYISNGLRSKYVPSWSPIYSLFYRILYQFCSTIPQVFLLSKFVLNFLLIPGLFFLISVYYTKGYVLSILIACSTSWTSISFFSNPNLPVFNLFLLLALFSSILYQKQFLKLFYAQGFFLILIFLNRSENLIFVFLYFFCQFYIFKSHLKNKKIFLKTSAGFLLLSIAFLVLTGGAYSSERIWKAFADHYYWNHQDLLGPAAELGRIDLVSRFFNNGATLAQVIVEKPEYIMSHVHFNFINLFKLLTNEMSLFYFPFFFIFPLTLFVLFRSGQFGAPAVIVLFLIFLKSLPVNLLLNAQISYNIEFLIWFRFIFILGFILWISKRPFLKFFSALFLFILSSYSAFSLDMKTPNRDLVAAIEKKIPDISGGIFSSQIGFFIKNLKKYQSPFNLEKNVELKYFFSNIDYIVIDHDFVTQMNESGNADVLKLIYENRLPVPFIEAYKDDGGVLVLKKKTL